MKPVYSGKVREIYEVSQERLVIVTTDRVSAFDHILPATVPGKGIVLNRLSNFWFEKVHRIVPGHVVSDRQEDMPEYFRGEEFAGRVTLVEKLKMLPLEFIVRGYCFGSMWEACRKGEDFCGIALPGKYRQAEKLERPLLTPARKWDREHDEPISMGQLREMLGGELAGRIEELCLALYELGSGYALERGLIIADAKFEFGQNSRGELVLADELFTPDSSRFWDRGVYRVGNSPPCYDKQVLRDWLAAHEEGGEMPFDKVPEELLARMGEIYRECLERIVG